VGADGPRRTLLAKLLPADGTLCGQHSGAHEMTLD
jgi:hypothetical protein